MSYTAQQLLLLPYVICQIFAVIYVCLILQGARCSFCVILYNKDNNDTTKILHTETALIDCA